MDSRLLELLERTLKATTFLAENAANGGGKYLTTLLGIYRVSFTTLRDIYYLSQNEGTGANILDLSRKIIEHGVAVEYMLLKGKEEMAERFQKYLAVQTHEELELMRAVGVDPAETSEELRINVEQAEAEYAALNSATRQDKNWAGRKFEDMLSDLTNAGAINAADSPRLVSSYVWGCRVNHPNPLAVHGYLDSDESKAADTFYSRLGIAMSLAGHLRLATRLIDESRLAAGTDIYPEETAVIAKIQEDLNLLD